MPARSMNKLIREYYAQWPLLGIGSILLIICLLGGAIFGVWKAFSDPTERSEQVTTFVYNLEGGFGYDAHLADNALYGQSMVTEDDTSVLYLNIVEAIEGRFSYRFISNQPVEHVWHRAEVTALLENGDNWSKPITLIPGVVKASDFTLTFPIDTDQLFELAETINRELGVGGFSYLLTLRADIHTIVETDHGAVNQLYSQSTSGTLQSGQLTWDGSLTKSQSGSLHDTIVVPIDTRADRIGWSLAGVLVLLLGFYVAWNYARSKPLLLTGIEQEARHAKRKHKDVIVDVDSLPEAKSGEVVMTLNPTDLVIPVSSLDELVKVSESLLRPVLHKVDPYKHIYCVIDGQTRFEYVSRDPTALEEIEPSGGGGESKY